MTDHREKFKELNQKITGNVKFKDGSLVEIKAEDPSCSNARMISND